MNRRKLIWGLAVLNAVLVVVLAWKLGGDNPAYAQARGRGEYIMVPADVPGVANGVIFVIDTRNALLSAFTYDQNKQTINTMDPIDLNRVFEGGGMRR